MTSWWFFLGCLVMLQAIMYWGLWITVWISRQPAGSEELAKVHAALVNLVGADHVRAEDGRVVARVNIVLQPFPIYPPRSREIVISRRGSRLVARARLLAPFMRRPEVERARLVETLTNAVRSGTDDQ